MHVGHGLATSFRDSSLVRGPARIETTERVLPADGTSLHASAPALVVVASSDSAQVGTRWPLLKDATVMLGREVSDRGLCLRDPGVSRLHARCGWDAQREGMLLTDMQSRNGVFVDGKPVREQLLSHGSVIRIGRSVLVYSDSDLLQPARERMQNIAPTDLTVLLCGETGTGKERFAKMIHQASGRPGPFVAINCGGIPKDLAAAEFFGHTKMAFSGATQARKGVFAAAARGTLLLDEIGDCPLDVQTSLLRVLQEKAVRPVGAEHELPVQTRVLAATHQDLELAVKRGSFRADLYARLKEATLVIPPLRTRKDELLLLAKSFAREQGAELNLSIDAAEALLCWNWPLNVRELRALVRTFVASQPHDEELRLAYLDRHHPELARPILERTRSEGDRDGGSLSLARSQRQQLRALLERHGGNVSKVADEMGKTRAHVYRWMRTLGLSVDAFRADPYHRR
jgi:transcriptional regulator with GAF, ATPase, and Fis domain